MTSTDPVPIRTPSSREGKESPGSRRSWSSGRARIQTTAQTTLRLMIQILHDFIHQNPKNCSSVVYAYMVSHAGWISSTILHCLCAAKEWVLEDGRMLLRQVPENYDSDSFGQNSPEFERHPIVTNCFMHAAALPNHSTMPLCYV